MTNHEGGGAVSEAGLRAALEPVMHWYQSDEHEDRPLLDIVADVVADLQSDRQEALAARAAVASAEPVESERVTMRYAADPETPAEMRARLDAAEAGEPIRGEVERLSDVLDTERYKVAIALQEIRKAIDGRRWLSEPGRGSYTYDDERYQQEFGGALDEIAAALEPLRKIAGDWSDCPRDPLRVAANRTAALTASQNGDA